MVVSNIFTMITDKEFKQAQKRTGKVREHGYAIKARFDKRTKRIVVRLNSGLDLGFPPEKFRLPN